MIEKKTNNDGDGVRFSFLYNNKFYPSTRDIQMLFGIKKKKKENEMSV